LIAEDEKMEMSRIRHRNNLIEIRHGYFGWRILKDAQKNEQGLQFFCTTENICIAAKTKP